MGEQTKIEWTDHTFNPWIGCTKLSPACDFCYAETMSKFRGWATWGSGEARMMTSPTNWRKPLKWNREAEAAGERHTVFCNSLADVFDAEVSNDWRAKLAGLITDTPHLDWLLLTKRHNVALKELPKMAAFTGNIRIGFTVENQPMADLRLPALRTLSSWGYRTFVSYGPSLGHVDWMPWMDCIDWLVAEGESGARARPAHPDWFRSARDACSSAGKPYHHKQNGEWVDKSHAGADEWRRTKERDGVIYGQLRRDGLLTHAGREFATRYPFPVRSDAGYYPGPCMVRVGLKRAGSLLDGVDHKAFPA